MKTTWQIILIIFLALFFFGCSSSKELSTSTTETVTIQPIKVEVPPINTIVTIPLVKPDTTNQQPYGEYEGEKEINQTNENGTITKAVIKTKVTIKKDSKGKPIADVKLDIKQSPIETKAQVVSSKTETNTKTENKSFLDSLSGLIMWFVILIIVIAGLGLLLYFKKLFWFKS